MTFSSRGDIMHPQPRWCMHAPFDQVSLFRFYSGSTRAIALSAAQKNGCNMCGSSCIELGCSCTAPVVIVCPTMYRCLVKQAQFAVTLMQTPRCRWRYRIASCCVQSARASLLRSAGTGQMSGAHSSAARDALPIPSTGMV